MVTLSCNATGKPIPNITWTRVWENGTDSGELPSMDGFYVISNACKSSDGTYRCKASNGVGHPANQTTEVIVGRKLWRHLRDYVNLLSLYLHLTLYTLTSVFIFFILFSVHLLRRWFKNLPAKNLSAGARVSRCKMQTADRAKTQTESKMRTEDCRPGVKCRLASLVESYGNQL